jgi:hypothetical protein
VHGAQTGEEAGRALASGAAVIFAEPDLSQLPAALRERVVEVARWARMPGYLPVDTVWRSWLTRDLSLLRQGMVAVTLPDTVR